MRNDKRPGCGVCSKCGEMLQCPECEEESESTMTSGCQYGITDEDWRWFLEQRLSDINHEQYEKWKEINKRYLEGMIEYYRDC